MNISDDEKKIDAFTNGHHLYCCLKKNLWVIIILVDDESASVEDDDTFTVECNLLDFSICLARGISTPQTMKLKGKLHYQDVLMLIDSGASPNFI